MLVPIRTFLTKCVCTGLNSISDSPKQCWLESGLPIALKGAALLGPTTDWAFCDVSWLMLLDKQLQTEWRNCSALLE